jgi:hypothetical protein
MYSFFVVKSKLTLKRKGTQLVAPSTFFDNAIKEIAAIKAIFLINNCFFMPVDVFFIKTVEME